MPAVLVFGVTDRKDEAASVAYEPDGPAQAAVAAIKDAVPEMVVITDVCLCGYTDHGHCGVVVDGEVHNDLSPRAAGADGGKPRGRRRRHRGAERHDGRARRRDPRGARRRGPRGPSILAYSAKYASAFYGPFREAAGSAPGFGDRRGYQMDPANGREAVRETLLDVAEGADMVMVKPAAAYLDVIAAVRAATDLPLAAYHVSGEYAMLKAAAERGWLDERRAALETLTGIAPRRRRPRHHLLRRRRRPLARRGVAP